MQEPDKLPDAEGEVPITTESCDYLRYLHVRLGRYQDYETRLLTSRIGDGRSGEWGASSPCDVSSRRRCWCSARSSQPPAGVTNKGSLAGVVISVELFPIQLILVLGPGALSNSEPVARKPSYIRVRAAARDLVTRTAPRQLRQTLIRCRRHPGIPCRASWL